MLLPKLLMEVFAVALLHAMRFLKNFSVHLHPELLLLTGTDVELGDQYFTPAANGGNGALAQALASGQTTEAKLRQAVRRVLSNRFRTGQFDPLEVDLFKTK